MIAKQSIGKSFTGALNYNLKKMHCSNPKERAELLTTNLTSMDPATISKELAIMKALNPKLTRNTYHTSLNFAIGEKVSNQKMQQIAEEYLHKMGFDNNLHIIFRHNDSNHPHCHILALRNRFDGTVVSDSQNYQRSEKVVRALENKYNLVKAMSSLQSKTKAPNKDELEMIQRTGKPSKKLLLQQKVKDALNHSITMRQFINHLERNNVNVLFNQASTGRVSGITFMIPGFKIRGQALGNQFKFGSIIKEINYEQSRDGKAIHQANDRTREKFGESKKAGLPKDHTRIRGFNEGRFDHGRKAEKNHGFSETTFADRSLQQRANYRAEHQNGINEESSKENTGHLDNSISHDSSANRSIRSGIIDLLDALVIESSNEINSKHGNKKKRGIR